MNENKIEGVLGSCFLKNAICCFSIAMVANFACSKVGLRDNAKTAHLVIQHSRFGIDIRQGRLGEPLSLRSMPPLAFATYKGSKSLNWETHGRVTRVNGRAVSVDISGMDEQKALQLIALHSGDLESIAWRAALNMDNSFMTKLRDLIEKPIFLNLALHRGPASRLRSLSVLENKIRGLHLFEPDKKMLSALPELSSLTHFSCRLVSDDISTMPTIDLGFLKMFPRLRDLKLDGYTVDRFGIGRITKLMDLKNLWITRITPDALQLIHKLRENKKLETLYVEEMTRNGAKGFSAHKNVKSVYLQSAHKDSLLYLSRMKRLSTLVVWGDLRNESSQSWYNLSRRRNLRRLELGKIPTKALSLIGRVGRSLKWFGVDTRSVNNHGLKHIGKLRGLNVLRIFGNGGEITDGGLSELGEMKDLTVLELASDELLGHGVERIGTKNNLKSIKISGNRCSEAVFNAVGEMTGLVRLVVDCRGFSSTAAEKVLPSGLRSLELLGSNITSRHLSVLRGCPKLEHLEVGGEGIDNEAMQWIGGLKNLKTLLLIGTNVDNEGIKKLDGLKGLRSLSLMSFGVSRFDSTVLEYFGEMKRLNILDLMGVRGIDEKALKNIKSMPELEEVTLDVSKLTPKGFKVFRGLAFLRELNLLGEVNVEGLLKLGNIPTLYSLDIRSGIEVEKSEFEMLRKMNPQCQFRGFFVK